MKGEINRILEILEGAKDENGCIPMALVRRAFKKLEQRWIPFESRALTDEEKEEHPEWDCVIVGPLPDDCQRILVSINLKGHEEVQYDEFYTDYGCYLDSG